MASSLSLLARPSLLTSKPTSSQYRIGPTSVSPTELTNHRFPFDALCHRARTTARELWTIVRERWKVVKVVSKISESPWRLPGCFDAWRSHPVSPVEVSTERAQRMGLGVARISGEWLAWMVEAFGCGSPRRYGRR